MCLILFIKLWVYRWLGEILEIACIFWSHQILCEVWVQAKFSSKDSPVDSLNSSDITFMDLRMRKPQLVVWLNGRIVGLDWLAGLKLRSSMICRSWSNDQKMYNGACSFLCQILSRHEVFPRLINDHLQEPELLRVDAERIRRQMQEVAVGHYRAFISAADAVQNITHEITSVDEHLTTLVWRHCLDHTIPHT